MEARRLTVLIMAAGTGGHVFPALSIADAMRAESLDVQWLGTPLGMENKLLENSDIPLHHVSVKGLRGAGLKRLLLAPFMIMQAFMQSIKVLRQVQPEIVVGMGGFVCGPAGIAAKVLGIPLVIHEQNAVAGLTNKLLARIANRVCEAFPGTFKPGAKVVFTGNPVRGDIAAIAEHEKESVDTTLNLLVLGGSQGAGAINEALPATLSRLAEKHRIACWHQTGTAQLEKTCAAYAETGIELSDNYRVSAFIEDMANAYAWADLVICRSGASTVSEIAVAGLTAIFIPYPHHRDNQQTLNAQWLSEAGAAEVLQQRDLSSDELLRRILQLADDRNLLRERRNKARSMAILNADTRIAELCKEIAHAS